MYLHDKQSKAWVQITDLEALFNPSQDEVNGRSQSGEEEQPPRAFKKEELAFPSGEALPQCWLDTDYQKA